MQPTDLLSDVFQERFARPPQHHDEMVFPPGTFEVGEGEDAAPLPGCVLRFIVNDGAPDQPSGVCANSGELTSWRIVRSPSLTVFPINVWACRVDDVRACIERLNDGVTARNPDLPPAEPTPADEPAPAPEGTAHEVAIGDSAEAAEETTPESDPS
jgi:hypothetical protein